jgi:recombination directionality factor gp3-like protein
MPRQSIMYKSHPAGALKRLGKIHKGAPKETRTKNGRTYQTWGKDLDYFRFEPDTALDPIEAAELRHLWDEQIGAKATRLLTVFVIGFTPDEAFATAIPYVEYNSSNQKVRECDGTTQRRKYDPRRGERDPFVYNVPCEYSDVEGEHSCVCGATVFLRLVVPALGKLGFVQFDCKSRIEINEIRQQLEFIYEAAQRVSGGVQGLYGIPFVFGREMRNDVPAPETVREGDKTIFTGRTIRTKKSLCYLRPTDEAENALLIPALTMLAGTMRAPSMLPPAYDAPALPNGADLDDEDGGLQGGGSEEDGGDQDGDGSVMTLAHWASSPKIYAALVKTASEKSPANEPVLIAFKALGLKRDGEKALQTLIIEQYTGTYNDAIDAINKLK